MIYKDIIHNMLLVLLFTSSSKSTTHIGIQQYYTVFSLQRRVPIDEFITFLTYLSAGTFIVSISGHPCWVLRALFKQAWDVTKHRISPAVKSILFIYPISHIYLKGPLQSVQHRTPSDLPSTTKKEQWKKPQEAQLRRNPTGWTDMQKTLCVQYNQHNEITV